MIAQVKGNLLSCSLSDNGRWLVAFECDSPVPLELKEELCEWLRQSSLPRYRSRTSVSSGTIELTAQLMPNELMFYFITIEQNPSDIK